jgi:FixJ family two-component response regulator
MPATHANYATRLSLVAVVEDDPALREAIRFSLSAEGYPVRPFDSGEALLVANDLDKVSCFVVDHRLPGIEGMALIEELQRRGLKARAVMITTRPSEVLREACWARGVPIVEKPILDESLNACIRGLLAQARA